jgi:predicted amidophosphoribosyltransferase
VRGVGGWAGVLDVLRAWLFPPACVACDAPGPALCSTCAPSSRDAVTFAIDAIPAFALGEYDGALRRAIVAMKRGERDPLDALADLLARCAPLDGVLVPLATTRSRAAQRGFDQSVELARRIARQRDLRCAEILRKRGSAQDGRSRPARLSAAGRFRVVSVGPLPNGVTLIDDVCTTGATIRDAVRTLAAAGVSVHGVVVVARTAPGRRSSTLRGRSGLTTKR